MIVYKYTLETDKENEFEMPCFSKVIHCHEQNNKVCIWVQVGTTEPVMTRKFICMVTGVEFDGGDYIGTCHLDNGKFVIHVFETTGL